MTTTTQAKPTPFVDLAAQHAPLTPEIHEAVGRILQQTDFILGRDVQLFEEEFAAFCDNTYAVGVDSGTSALELALRAYGIGPGDEVITTANTFIATVFAISHTGATPVLVDVDPATYTLDVARLNQALTPRTRAIIAVHRAPIWQSRVSQPGCTTPRPFICNRPTRIWAMGRAVFLSANAIRPGSSRCRCSPN